MYILISAFLIAGAFAIAGTATSAPVSPWLMRAKAETPLKIKPSPVIEL